MKNTINYILIHYKNQYFLMSSQKNEILQHFPKDLKVDFLNFESIYYSNNFCDVINYCVSHKILVKEGTLCL